ncbi:MAG: zinc ribbon domain-containing protein [Mycobacterium sp.]
MLTARFCPAPNQSVFWPSPASSLLPQLSRSARRPFTVGLVLIVVALAVLVELRLTGAIIAVAALGLPLLLVICWLRAGVLQGIPRWAVATTVVLAIGLAAGWVLLTGDLITTLAESAFDAGTAGRRVLRDGLGIAEGGVLLMLVPPVVVRLLWRSPREVLDGFVIGVLSALLFTAAATLTRLAPQFVAAPVARNQPVQWLFFEVAVRGVTVPVTAACAGGLIGILLWFVRRSGKSGRVNGPLTITVLLILGLAVLGEYAVMGWADIEGVSQFAVLAWHVGMAILALIASRLGLQLVLLNDGESPDLTTTLKQSLLPVVATWLAVMSAVSAAIVVVPALTVKPLPRFNCPPDCGSPPKGQPVSANPRFTAADGSFSFAYPAPGTAYDINIDDRGVTATFLAGDGGKLRLTSEPAAGRTAQEVAQSFVTMRFPSAQKAFEIPNAMVGFEPGYGEVADVFPLNLDASNNRLRSVIVVAIKNDIALIAAAIGPYHQFGPSFGPGRPSPTNLQIAEDMGRYVNGFRWRGDPPT